VHTKFPTPISLHQKTEVHILFFLGSSLTEPYKYNSKSKNKATDYPQNHRKKTVKKHTLSKEKEANGNPI